MRKVLFIGLIVLCSGCFRHQHEERIANGDTGYINDTTAKLDTGRYIIIPDSRANVLYEAKCRSCHYQYKRKRILCGFIDRIPPGDWKYNWFHNPDSMIAAGDPYAKKLKADWNNLTHPAFPELSREEIDELLQYISEW